MRFLKALKCNHGSGLIIGMAAALLICAVFAFGLFYFEYSTTVSYIRTQAQDTLDQYTTEQGEKAADNIKNNSTYSVVLNESDFKDIILSSLGMNNDGIAHENGRVRFKITDISLAYTAADELASTALINIEIPIYLDSKQVYTANGILKISTTYLLKH